MSVKEIRAEELRNLIRNQKGNLEIIDVREPEEYEIIHIKGSKLMPMNDLQSRLDEIDWNKQVIFVCRSGNRSGLMANLVSASAGKNIHNLQYGIYECFSDGKKEFLKIADGAEGYF